MRYAADRLDDLMDAIDATGYGLTLGIHSRIETTQRRIAERLRIGNTYVNRNQIGAVVGVQPFGGRGLSGTGPKAGGPITLYRFAEERVVSINTAAAGGNAALLASDEANRGNGSMIGVDWGTTSFRAFRIARDGTIRDRRTALRGLVNVPDNRFADTLRDEIGPWLAAGEDHVLLSGMIGSRQGWKEAPYLPCPAGAPEVAAGAGGDRVRLGPGEAGARPVRDRRGGRRRSDARRGDAGVRRAGRDGRQRAGLPAGDALEVGAGRGRPDRRLHHPHDRRDVRRAARPHDPRAHDARGTVGRRAVRCRACGGRGDPGGLLHHIFGARSLVLAGRLAETEAAAYLSGILIGHEVRAALAGRQGEVVHVIGAPELTLLYARAISAHGGYPERHDGEAAARGLALIGGHAAGTDAPLGSAAGRSA